MDTIFVEHLDTVIDTAFVIVGQTLEGDVKKWWMHTEVWVAIAAIAAALSAIMSAIGIWSSRRIQRNAERLQKRTIRREIGKEWAEQVALRNLLRTRLEVAYDLWLQEIKWTSIAETHRPPESLTDLLFITGIPDRISERCGDDSATESFWSDLPSELPQSGRWLHQFMNRVHNQSMRSIVIQGVTNAQEQWDEFYEARSELSYHFETWHDTAPIELLQKKFYPHRTFVTMLVWLEISLVNVVQRAWVPQTGLFQLASQLHCKEE